MVKENISKALSQIGWTASGYLKSNPELNSIISDEIDSEKALLTYYISTGIFEDHKYKKYNTRDGVLNIESVVKYKNKTMLLGWSSLDFEDLTILAKSNCNNKINIDFCSFVCLRYWRNDVSSHLNEDPKKNPYGFIAIGDIDVDKPIDYVVFIKDNTYPCLNIPLATKFTYEAIFHEVVHGLNPHLVYDECCYIFSKYPRFLKSLHVLNHQITSNASKNLIYENIKHKPSNLSVCIVTLGKPQVLKAFLMTQIRKFEVKETEFLVYINGYKNHNEIINACKFASFFFNANIKVYGSTENIGFNGAVNHLISQSNSPHSMICNIDIEFINFKKPELDKLAKRDSILVAMQYNAAGCIQHKSLSISIANKICHGNKYEVIESRLDGRNTFKKSNLPISFKVDFFGAACLYAKTEILKKLGPFSLNYLLAYHEDTDLAIRARGMCLDLIVTQDLAIIHYESSASEVTLPKSIPLAANVITVTNLLKNSHTQND